MTTFFTLQLIVPLILVAWMAAAPARSGLGFWLQLTATAAGLIAMGLTGLWLLPPWWTPYAFGVLLLPAAISAWRQRRPFVSVLPRSIAGWGGAAFFVALASVALWQTALALRGRAPPPEKQVELAFPLERGNYLVVDGGYALSINAHLTTLNPEVPRFNAWRGQSYGVDLVKINAAGLRTSGVQPAEPAAYLIYGTRVLAPCGGEVMVVVDGLPDMQVPKSDHVNLAANHVMLRCAGGDVLLGHLSSGSVKVQAGTRVRVGDWLGTVGNSGNTGEPHLHIHAQRPGSAHEPISGDPLPVSFGGRLLVRNDRISIP